MEKPIFIVGLTRSGSTVWHNIIAQNPTIYRIGEMNFLTPWSKDFDYFYRKQVGDLSDNENVTKMVDLLLSQKPVPGLSRWFWRTQLHSISDEKLKENLYKGILASDRSLGSIFKIIIEQVTKSTGYSRCCVKFPVYPSYIPQLLQWYPDCRIIHITRDPRAICISKANDPGGTQKLIKKYPYMESVIRKIMIFLVIIQYNWTSKIHSRYKHLDNYALFRYEDLLVDPQAVIKRLSAFAEIDFYQEMINLKGTQKSSITGNKAMGFDKKAAARWKQVISPFEEKMISLLTRKAMARLEYDPETHPIYLS